MERKLTLDDAIRIRVLHRRGVRVTDLAEQFGVTKGNITHIIQRKTHRLDLGTPSDKGLTKQADWYRPEKSE